MKVTHYKDYRNRTKAFKYFVSYSFQQGHKGGFGNVEILRYGKFKGINDVKRWARDYEKEMGFAPNTLVVLNFQLF